MKDVVTLAKAKNLLEKALVHEETYLPAVYYLAEIYEQEGDLEGAINFLEKHAETHSTCRIHRMLGELYRRTQNHEKALDHYAIALK